MGIGMSRPCVPFAPISSNTNITNNVHSCIKYEEDGLFDVEAYVKITNIVEKMKKTRQLTDRHLPMYSFLCKHPVLVYTVSPYLCIPWPCLSRTVNSLFPVCVTNHKTDGLHLLCMSLNIC